MSEFQEKAQGRVFLLSAPSGGGKTTLAKALCKWDPRLFLSISTTTRRRRPIEKDGTDYYFVTEKVFQRAKAEGTFLETSENFGHFYGTPRIPVERALSKGRDVIMTLDFHGYKSVRARIPGRVVGVFVYPPSQETLKQRLLARKDCDETLDARLAEVDSQLASAEDYEYKITNDQVEKVLAELRRIIEQERSKPLERET